MGLLLPRKRQAGFSVLDALVGVFILAVGSLCVGSLMPTLARSQKMSHDTSMAVQIATRELEQLRLAGYANANYTSLRSLNLVDLYSGSGPYKFSNVNLDNASHLSAASALRSGTGELIIDQTTPTVRQLTVTVKWLSPNGTNRSVSMSMMLGKDA
jgi:Tfp pilus assembly protein PilV